MSERKRVSKLCNRGFNKSRKTLAKYAVVHNKENELEIEKTSVNTSTKLKPMDNYNDISKKQDNFTCNSCKQAMSKRCARQPKLQIIINETVGNKMYLVATS